MAGAVRKAFFVGSFKMKLAGDGRVRLPKQWQAAFRGGVAFVRYDKETGCLVVSPTWRGLEDEFCL